MLADVLGDGGVLAGLRPLLPAVCHMAVSQASAALVPGGDASAAPDGGAQEPGWGEAALVAALMAVRAL